jgi:two-component sensor histidine kinase
VTPTRLPTLRALVALALAAMAFATAAALAAAVAGHARSGLEAQIAEALEGAARHMRDQLDVRMSERWRDVQVMASLPPVNEPDAPAERRRAVVQRMKETFPHYAWVGFIEAGGRIVASSDGHFEGGDARIRPWFHEALKAPFLGDVHEAVVLSRFLSPTGKEPLRFVDVARPVIGPGGQVLGVLGTHVSWSFAQEIAASVPHPGGTPTDFLILARDGRVILGPEGLAETVLHGPLAELARGKARSGVVTWPDDRAYLTAGAPTRGHHDYPGLGWTVLVRQDAGAALAAAAKLQQDVLAWGAVVAALLGGLGWIAAGWIARPLDALTLVADRLGRGEEAAVPLTGGYREARALSTALAVMVDELQARTERQGLLIAELSHRVKNTLAVVQSMARRSLGPADADPATVLAAFTDRLKALGNAHVLLAETGWAGTSLARILEAELRPLAGAAAAISGPEVAISPRAAQTVTLAIHELAANARRHGALSVPGGRLALSWAVERRGDGTWLAMDWTEDGGPPVLPPGRRGFGLALVERGVPHELGGTAAFDFRPEGLVARISFPLEDAAGRVA